MIEARRKSQVAWNFIICTHEKALGCVHNLDYYLPAELRRMFSSFGSRLVVVAA